jgi:C-3',4' desaturase CrtD
LHSHDIGVIGGGVAGLTAAVLLAREGANVTLYEHHNVAGGCASFYQRDGFRFEVGATVASGFAAGGIHGRVFRALGIDLEAQRLDPAMAVHIAGETILRFGDGRWPIERVRAFGASGEAFWTRQERIADAAWEFARTLPALPTDARSALHMLASLRPRQFGLPLLQGRTVASIIPPNVSPLLRTFVDLQLLITAQGVANEVDLTYGSTALDIAREGVFHLRGGIGTIATTLARALRHAGGTIRYGTSVARIIAPHGRVEGLELENGERVATSQVVAAIPYENVRRLLGLPTAKNVGGGQRWSAVTAYAGTAPGDVPADAISHHQVLLDAAQPLGEANSVFVSISAPDDPARARNGGRAITLSTHTDVAGWERAAADGTLAQKKDAYAAKLQAALSVALGKETRPVFFELGVPATFERFTLRARGLVGGVPQTPRNANLRARSHRSGVRGLVLCGDTVFPGQSTVGVTLSGINAARALGAEVALPA